MGSVLKQHEEQSVRREYLKRQKWDMNKLVEQVSGLMKARKESLRRKGRLNAVSEAKGLIAYRGKQELGMNGAEIGEYPGASRQAVSRLFSRGELPANKRSLKVTFDNVPFCHSISYRDTDDSR